ncbi:DUF3369 domain-containing protein [Paenibacillus turpanensis]|uniref:DUF3369 domain-containing protein n=1 Tax=Paenibacillus turpanensis TaxID=2689078 RepID=UPI00140C5C0B|nr:DUF3369 domain-containing protein [Paenibacillus turpanensis]
MLDNNNELQDELLFADEETEIERQSWAVEAGKWKIAIVDDESEVHQVTRMVLSDFEYAGKGIEWVSAYSAQEAREVLAAHTDLAVILLDVVMEEEHSGLHLVRYIREELGNSAVRIILRTGQPGQAPERDVITHYDINDYKEKTELTAQKLYTTLVAALRTYQNLKIIENNKLGLEEIIKSSSTIFEMQSMKKFSSAVLSQLVSILQLNRNAIHANISSFAVSGGGQEAVIVAATGDYSGEVDRRLRDVAPEPILRDIEQAFAAKTSLFMEDRFVIYFRSKTGAENAIYMQGSSPLEDWDRYLIEIYSSNVSVAFDNIYLNEELEHTQKEIIFTLGEIVETRSKETGFHVKRVAEYSKVLAQLYGLSEEDAELLRLASPMHDVGKVGIPDHILNKPGKLTSEEFDVIRTHTTIGYSMLQHSDQKIIHAAALIALQHHEKADGSGYPNGLKLDEIHIFARITALADVFDALASERVYKKAWPMEEIIAYIREQRGKQFDPRLVDLFLEHVEQFLYIRDKYDDSKIF